MPQSHPKTWLITGTSTGFGRALAERVLASGERAVMLVRKPESMADLLARFPETARALALDVIDTARIAPVLEEAAAAFGRIDVLINNAGYGVMGANEETAPAEYRPMFETNVFGLIEVTRAALPYFRRQRSGHIINISSQGGFSGRAGVGLYNATKFAVEGFSESLAQEVAPLGIKVTIVEPGSFRTDWAGRSMVKAAQVIEDYTATAGSTRAAIDNNNGRQAGDPVRGADAIIQVAHAAEPPLRLVLGRDALARVREKLAQVAGDIEAWKETTLSCAFDA